LERSFFIAYAFSERRGDISSDLRARTQSLSVPTFDCKIARDATSPETGGSFDTVALPAFNRTAALLISPKWIDSKMASFHLFQSTEPKPLKHSLDSASSQLSFPQHSSFSSEK
jgi:hypothetical protein